MNIVVVLAGLPPGNAVLKQFCPRADKVIAVDGGYLAFQGSGLLPDVLIGDLDSLGADPAIDGSVQVESRPSQDETDLQKALTYCRSLGDIESIIVLGGTGLRTDHLLNNLLILAGMPASLEICMISASEAIYRVTPEFSFAKRISMGKALSIIPITDCTSVNTSGLEWDLDHAKMGVSHRLSQSNRVQVDEVTIQCGSGILYVIVNQ